MRFEAKLKKSGKYWLIEAPALDVMTEGRTKKEACLMLKDAIELLVDTKNFVVTVSAGKKSSERYVSASDQDKLISLLLRRQRQKHGLTLKEVASRLGASSINAFARYEQGKSRPTVGKLMELIEAINPDLTPVLKLPA